MLKIRDILIGLIPYTVLIGICWGVYKIICFLSSLRIVFAEN